MAALTLDTSTDPQVGFRPPGNLDAATALAPYTGHFGERQAAHLLRRAGFGGSAADVTRLAALGCGAAVDSLLHPPAADLPFADYPPRDVLYALRVGQQRSGTQLWWLDRMLRTQHPLSEKMTLFWHGHFATSILKVPPPLMARQIDLFRSQGLGNFRELLAAVSVDPAMTIWLDNRFNTKAHPNENYAREVMELFTLGLGNYSETDVKEAARAFTGWSYRRATMSVEFNERTHDDGPKTILGRSGRFGLTDVVDILVEQPVHQRFIARKLLEFFVYSDPEPALTEALAQTYALAGFDIAKTVGTILRSQVFFSPRAYRAVPKSPIEFTIGLLRFTGAQSVPPSLPATLRRMGQEPLAPPSVKGWDGGPAWINTNTLLARFNFVNALIATSGTTLRAGPSPGSAPHFAIGAPANVEARSTASAATPTSPGSTASPATMMMSPSTISAPESAPADATAISPDAIVARAGGMDARRVVDAIVAAALQNDVTSDIRSTLLAFLDSDPSGGVANGLPFGPENYQEKIRGALALTLNLPVNQLD